MFKGIHSNTTQSLIWFLHAEEWLEQTVVSFSTIKLLCFFKSRKLLMCNKKYCNLQCTGVLSLYQGIQAVSVSILWHVQCHVCMLVFRTTASVKSREAVWVSTTEVLQSSLLILNYLCRTLRSFILLLILFSNPYSVMWSHGLQPLLRSWILERSLRRDPVKCHNRTQNQNLAKWCKKERMILILNIVNRLYKIIAKIQSLSNWKSIRDVARFLACVRTWI